MAKVTITIPVGLQFTYDEKRISREEALETAIEMTIQPSVSIVKSVQVINVYTEDKYGHIHYHC